MSEEKNLSKAIIYLFHTERFYAELISKMDRLIDRSISTAAVSIKENIRLHINPDTFYEYPVEVQAGILKHECEHILRDHIARSKDYAPEVWQSGDFADNLVNKQMFTHMNVAMDLAINGGLEKILPPEGCFPDKMNLPRNLAFEEYMNLLKDRQDLIGDDGHKLWKTSEGSAAEIKQKIRDAVNAAAKVARRAGNLPGDLEILIRALNKPRNDWKAQLRRFVARSNNIDIDVSRMKRHRRYGLKQPGQIKKEKIHVGVAIDTSGSITDEIIMQFMSEIKAIARHSKVTVMEIDTEVREVYEFDPKRIYSVQGGGGTAYAPAFEYFNKDKENPIDGLIYFGDMDCFDQEQLKKPKYSVLWAIVEGGSNQPATFGSSISIPLQKNT